MRIAVVTGASSGIGREFVRELDKKGLDEIWLIARREERLMALKDELCTSGRVMRLDLTDDADIDAFERTLEREKPDVMYMVNAAGFGKIGRYDEISREDNAGMMALNVSARTALVCGNTVYEKGLENNRNGFGVKLSAASELQHIRIDKGFCGAFFKRTQ